MYLKCLLAQPANVVSVQSASPHVPENGPCVLHPIMGETTGEQSIQLVGVWHCFVSVRQKSWKAVIYEPVPRGAEARGDVRASRLWGSRKRGRKHNSCTFLRSV